MSFARTSHTPLQWWHAALVLGVEAAHHLAFLMMISSSFRLFLQSRWTFRGWTAAVLVRLPGLASLVRFRFISFLLRF
jgi:hypothetical protein